MDIFKLFGRIAIDSSDATSELNRFMRLANNAGRKVGKAFTDITKGAKAMGTALNNVGNATEQTMRKIANGMALATAAASAAAVTIGKKSLDIRSSIEQGMGGADAVFQQYSKHIKESAQDAWKTAGLSVEEYLATANKMGSLFKGAGFSEMQAVELTANAMQRAADVASIMGIDVSMAMESIAGMAKGNFTMMDNLGVAMNDTTLEAYRLEKGIAQSVSTMTTAEKVGLAYEMFMERTADYAGNYAKENETAAGSLQTLKASWENFLGGVGTFEDLENSAFGYLRIAAKTMGLEDFLPLIDGAEQTVEDVTEILSMEDLSGRQKFAKARRYLLDKSVNLASAMGDYIVKGADNVSTIVSETLSDINVNLPHYLEVGRKIFDSVRDGVKKASEQLINSAAIIAPDAVSGWFDLKTDFITIGLNFLGSISQAISDDLAKGPESKVGASLKNGMHTVLDGLARNLPKMTKLATALIDGLSDAILSTDEDGKTIDEKINEVIDSIINELVKWIEDGGPGRFTYAATTFLFNFGEALVAEAPTVFKGFVDGLVSAFSGVIGSAENFFFGKNPEAESEAESTEPEAQTTGSTPPHKSKFWAKEQTLQEDSDAAANQAITSADLSVAGEAAVKVATGATLFTLAKGFLTKHPIIGTAALSLGSVEMIKNWLISGAAEKAAKAAKAATGGIFDPTNLFAERDENGEYATPRVREMLAAQEAYKEFFSDESQIARYKESIAFLEDQKKALEAEKETYTGETSAEAVSKINAIEVTLQQLDEGIAYAQSEIEKFSESTDSTVTEIENLSTQSDDTAGSIENLGAAADSAATKLSNISPMIAYYREYGGGVNDSIQFEAETPGFASGLAYVPRDNLLARLHQGEAVLTAKEAYEWRQQKNGKLGNIEMAVAQLANAVAELQEGFNANMNLYINKKHVASALSRDMGRSIGNREYTLLRGMGG